MVKNHLYIIAVLLFFSCSAKEQSSQKEVVVDDQTKAQLDTAYFASGCFWCTEAVYERVKGVTDVISGYSGGEKKNPTYQAVSYGRTNHTEAVRVAYDPDVVSYEDLVYIFFGSHDPTQLNRQGPDVGKQYRSAIFYTSSEEKKIAENVMKELNEEEYNGEIVTKLTDFTAFWPAEDYHQNYYEIHPNQPYIVSVSKPKVEKFMKRFKDKLKEEYK